MSGNRGQTALRCRRRTGCSMREYDRLPAELRAWLAVAILPWAPRSARRAYDRALSRTASPRQALQELDRIQARLVAKDAGRIWGRDHPDAEER